MNDKDNVSIDEERVVVTKRIDLANNVQARYASISREKPNLITLQESKILFEISLGLRC